MSASGDENRHAKTSRAPKASGPALQASRPAALRAQTPTWRLLLVCLSSPPVRRQPTDSAQPGRVDAPLVASLHTWSLCAGCLSSSGNSLAKFSSVCFAAVFFAGVSSPLSTSDVDSVLANTSPRRRGRSLRCLLLGATGDRGCGSCGWWQPRVTGTPRAVSSIASK